MENTQTISKFSLNPGLILGGILVFISVATYVSDIDIYENTWIGWFTYLVMAFAFYYFQKTYRNNINGGYLSLSEAVRIGITIAVIAGSISAVYNAIFYKIIDPEYIEDILLKMEEKMVEQDPNISQNQINLALEITRKTMAPYISIPLGIVGSAISGLILSLATGFFVKKKNPSFQ